MSKTEVRLATEADNDKIVELSKRCLQEGMITMFINRTPRFNTLHRILDESAWHFVAVRGEKIIGLVGVIHFDGRIIDRESRIGYMLDLRVATEYRRGTTAFKLVKAAVDHIDKSGTSIIIVNFLKDNKHPLVFTSGRAGLPAAYYLGDNNVFNILPLFRMKLNNRFEVSHARKEDIPELLRLYKGYASRFTIAPVINEENFAKFTSSVIGLSLDNFLVARENGKIMAVTAVWDEHSYKSYQVLKLNFALRIMTTTLRFLSLFMKTPRPIRLNEPLKQLSLVLYAHDDCPEALDTLFRHVNNMHRGGDYTLIMFYARETDPMFTYMKKFTGVTVKSEMHMFSRDHDILKRLQESQGDVLFDLTMLL